jgi:hydroxymethylpyrimidine pyrophosphatase-like HAD family hydrolase
MRCHALVCDYDGTLAHDGRVDEPTVAALERLLATGRKLILVTGRELPELQAIFPELHFFARVVAENGALLYNPGTREEKLLATPPPPEFVQALRDRHVTPLATGRVIVATWRPHETVILETIRDLGLELQVIFNKESVMVLPSGVNKASGLAAALADLGLTAHEAVGVGDAENDHAFLSVCECAVAVANALPSVLGRADLVTRGARGAGVTELIDRLVENDLADLEDRLARHQLVLGTRDDGEEFRLSPYGHSILIAGPSGSGKSTAALSFLERLAERAYQYCIIDPEGDYDSLEGAVVLGDQKRGPTPDEVLRMLTTTTSNVVANLVGLPVVDRPPFFLGLLPRLEELRARTGRPHWLIVDEAHHLLPASWKPGPLVLPADFKRALFITVHPGQVAAGVLATVDTVLAVGPSPEDTVRKFLAGQSENPPALPHVDPRDGEITSWSRSAPDALQPIRLTPSRLEHHRHIRKYAEGELPPDRSFNFRGPEGKLNLRAQNLGLFLQIADGVDDATWTYHLRQGDYSRWFRERIKDEHLAEEAARVEQQTGLSPRDSRAQIRALIERTYTLPADPPLPIPGTDASPTHGA